MTEPDDEHSPNSSQKPKRIRQICSNVGLFLLIAILINVTAYLIYAFRVSYVNQPMYPHSTSDEQRIRAMAAYNSLAAINSKDKQEEVENEKEVDYDQEDPTEEETNIRKMMVADTHLHVTELMNTNISLPDSFDARDRWSQCRSVHRIQNQGGCGSCWAAAATSMISDRLCIASNYSNQSMASMEDLVSCCVLCGGCPGTRFSMLSALYFKISGVVSGGGFGSKDGCRPYSIDSTCGAPCPPSYFIKEKTPYCKRECQTGYKNDYESDRIKARRAYWLSMSVDYYSNFYTMDAYHALSSALFSKGYPPPKMDDLIKRDILLYGPAMLSMIVNESFLHYKSGIYSDPHVETNKILTYGHCMKVLGWGREEGREYWIVANSWGTQWGENGFARISTNTSNWEQFDVVAALI